MTLIIQVHLLVTTYLNSILFNALHVPASTNGSIPSIYIYIKHDYVFMTFFCVTNHVNSTLFTTSAA